MTPDSTYAETRRRGRPGTIVRVTGTAADPQTGAKTDTTTSYTFRWVVKGPIKFSRLYRAQATQQDIGDTEFHLWTGDTNQQSLTSVDQEDYVTFGGKRYEVVAYTVEETAFIILARDMGE